MTKNKNKKLFTIKNNKNKINMEVNESNFNHFQSLTPLQQKELSCGIKQQKFIPSDRMKPHIAQHRRPAIRAAYPIGSIAAQHR